MATGPTNNYAWRWITCSADGSKILAATLNGLIFRSTDSGATWTSLNAPSGLYGDYDCIASSADGTKLVTSTFEGTNGGYTFSSSDSGATWVTNNPPNLAWSCIASSADGTRLFICMKKTYYTPSGGPIYSSTNAGANWVRADAPAAKDWLYVATSADGARSVAVAKYDGIYTWQSTPTPQLSITLAGDYVRVFWTIPSMPLVLQENSNPATLNWTEFATAASVSNFDNQVFLPATTGGRVYRLKGSVAP